LSWGVVWLRTDDNGNGFDAFVTDSSLARLQVAVTVEPFSQPTHWPHPALSWDGTRGVGF
jgi:hypothetical protein